MKKLFILFVLLTLTFADKVFSQEDRVSQEDTLTSKKSNWEGLSITFLTGETSLTKGNTLTAVWKKEKSILVADINNDLGEFMYFYYPKKWFSIGPSAGFLYGRPYIGPIGTIELCKGNFSFKTLDWLGWDFGNAIDTCSFLFSFHQFTFGYEFNKKITSEAYFALQHFRGEPEQLFGVKETFRLNKNWSAFGGWGYMVKKDYHLWSCGINFSF